MTTPPVPTIPVIVLPIIENFLLVLTLGNSKELLFIIK